MHALCGHEQVSVATAAGAARSYVRGVLCHDLCARTACAGGLPLPGPGPLPQPGPLFQELPEPAPLLPLPEPFAAEAPMGAPGGLPGPGANLQVSRPYCTPPLRVQAVAMHAHHER